MQNADLIVSVVTYYLYAGAAVAVVFLVFGIERVQSGSRGSHGFRALLVPGLCLLWPLVLWRWYVLEKAGESES